MTLEILNNIRVFLRRLPTLPGGITSDIDCIALANACAYVEREMGRLAQAQDAARIETAVKAALVDLEAQSHDGA